MRRARDASRPPERSIRLLSEPRLHCARFVTPIEYAAATRPSKSRVDCATIPGRPAMTMNQPNIEQIQRAVATSLHEHWVLFLVEGIVLVVLGLLAIVVPPIATLAVEILFGLLFLISGILGLVTTHWMRQAPGFL